MIAALIAATELVDQTTTIFAKFVKPGQSESVDIVYSVSNANLSIAAVSPIRLPRSQKKSAVAAAVPIVGATSPTVTPPFWCCVMAPILPLYLWSNYMVDPRTSAGALRVRDTRFRTFAIKRSASGQKRFDFPVSSETPVARGDASEILSHAPGAVRLARANAGVVPLLFNHNWDDPIGMISSAELKNKRLDVTGGFFNTTRGQEVSSMVESGLRNVSLGYQIHAISENARAGTFTATDWEPYEVSIVSVPADPSVGVGRKMPTQPARAVTAQAPRKPAPTIIAIGSKPTPGTREHAALHEASHACVLTRGGVPFKHAHLFDYDSGEVAGIDTPSDARGLECMVVAALAGGAAANEDDPSYPGAARVTAGAAGDFRQAMGWISTLCRDHDFESREPLIRHGLSPLAIFEERAHTFVRVHRRQIYLVANELLARKKLTAAEVAELVA
jgi:HK97 family phage prohead protease